MGRAPNRRDLSTSPGPRAPGVGTAGKDIVRNPAPSRKQAQQEPVQPVIDRATGLGIKSGRASPKSVQRPAARDIAGKSTSTGSVESALGTSLTPGKRGYGKMAHAQTAGLVKMADPGKPAVVKADGDAAGKTTEKLSAHNGVPLTHFSDTSNARKGENFRGNHSTVDSVVFNHEMDSSANADMRDFEGACGVPSSAAEHAGLFATQKDLNKFSSLKSTADKVIFGRDIDGMDDVPDMDMGDAAGTPSKASAHAGIFSEKSDRVSFDEIPHSQFSQPGLKFCDSMGSRAEEIIYYRPENPEDDDYTETNLGYHGAAGESSKKASERWAKEQLVSKKKVKAGDSEVDALIFGRDLDISASDDHIEDQLYSGAGTRSKMNMNPMDVATRSTDKIVDATMYGNVDVVGSGMDLEPSGALDRNELEIYQGAAGSNTKYLSEREMSSFDIQKRLPTGAGSSNVNPSEVDELIWGRNVDQSGADARDFDDSAGMGARLNLRNPTDITVNPPRRLRVEKNPGVGETDEVIYGHDVGAKSTYFPSGSSSIDSRSDVGRSLGMDSNYQADTRDKHESGHLRNKMVTQKQFSLLQGESSSLVADLVEENTGTFNSLAGVQSQRLSEKRVSDHKRALPLDMVPDPAVPPGERDLKPLKNLEFSKLHGAVADNVIYQQPDDPNEMRDYAKEANALGEIAGLTSSELSIMRSKPGGPPQYPDEKPPDYLVEGAAGRPGTVAAREQNSRKAGVVHKEAEADKLIRMEKPCEVKTSIEEEELKRKAGLTQGGSVASRANFRHHSQSARVGSVVFGVEPPKMVKDETGAIMSVGEDHMHAMFRGTVSNDRLEEHFTTAAGKQSPSFYRDLNHELDKPVEKMRLHDNEQVDDVVFGHDIDGSEAFGRRKYEGAGKESRDLANSRHWFKRDVGRAQAAGEVDEVVYGHDIDQIRNEDVVQEGRRFDKSAGASSIAVLSTTHLNDPSSRMHMPTEWQRHGSKGANLEKLDSIVFNHEIEGAQTDWVERERREMDRNFADSSGSNTDALNAPKLGMQHKKSTPMYQQTRGKVDDMLYGGPANLRATVSDIMDLQEGAAGRSDVTRTIHDKSESKRMVPHKAGDVAEVMFPMPGGLETGKRVAKEGNEGHMGWIEEHEASGAASRSVARVRDREVEYVDGVADSRKGRGPPRAATSMGAAGKPPPPDGSLMQTKARQNEERIRSGPRQAGKTSGLHDNSGNGVAAAVGNSGSSPARRPPAGASSDSTYSAALAEGRQLLKTSYTPSPSSPVPEGRLSTTVSRTEAIKFVPGGDSAGNFRKSPAQKLAKPRPETLTASAPFGVDAPDPNARFQTSAASIGSRSREKILPYAVASSFNPNPPPTAIVPAGMRVKSAGPR